MAGIAAYIASVEHDLLTNDSRGPLSLFKLALIYGGFFVFIVTFTLSLFAIIYLLGFSTNKSDDSISRISLTIKRLQRSGNSPVVFALLYLSMLPVFATIYASLPEKTIYSATRTQGDHFYQEQYNYDELGQAFDPGFESALQKAFPALPHWASSQIDDPRIFDEDYFVVDYAFRFGQDNAGFAARLYLPRQKLHRYGSSGSLFGLHIVTAFLDETICSKLNCDVLKRSLDDYTESLPTKDELLRPPTSSATRVDMRMSDRQFMLLTDLSYALDGNALGHYGRFSRAIYLSATVITTLGFGDMVPVSDEARHIVTLQSMMGIIVIGLFLNSLASKRTRDKSRTIR